MLFQGQIESTSSDAKNNGANVDALTKLKIEAGGSQNQTTEKGVHREVSSAEDADEFLRRPSAPSRLMKDVPMLLNCQDDRFKPESAMKSAVMTKSLPNLSDVRSKYNRGIGFSVLSSTNESGMSGCRESSLRIAEFDKLLEGL